MEINETTDAGQNQSGSARPKETDIIKQALETGQLPEIEQNGSTNADNPGAALRENTENTAGENA